MVLSDSGLRRLGATRLKNEPEVVSRRVRRRKSHFICPKVAAENHKQHNEQAEYQTCILESFHCTPRFENPLTTVTYKPPLYAR